MAGESNADVYASFGVNNAVTTSGDQSEHEQNMLALNVDARDGDDRIDLVDNNEDPYNNTDKFASEESDRVQIRVNTESGEATVDGQGNEEGTDGAEPNETFEALGETPSELTESSEQLSAYEEGLQEMIDGASERGLTPESIARIQEEYQGDGISEQSYKELAEAGYSKAFVDSYIRGQESLVDAYVAQIKNFAGGASKFDAVLTHMQTTDSQSAEALMDAIERRDLSTVRALINAGGASYSAKFGKPSERTVTNRATPSKAEAPKVSGFESQAEMVKAMADSRYRTDAAYRREVEQKVINSTFHW